MTRITTNSMTTPNRLLLQGRALFFARLVWVVATLVSVGLFLLTLSIRDLKVLEYLAMPELSRVVQDYGISIEGFTYFVLIRKTLFTAIFVVVGLLLFLRKSSERAALFISLTLILFGTVGFIAVTQGLGMYPTWIQWLGKFMQLAATIAIGLFFYIFPDGHFVPRWTRYAALAWIILHTQKTLFGGAAYATTPGYLWLERILTVGFVISWVLAQVTRYRNTSNQVQRQQTKWVVLGASMAVIGWFAITFIIRPSAPNVLWSEIRSTLQLIFFLFIPLSIALAMFRFRLWDIDPIVNRTLVYATLTALVIGIYVLIVGYLSILFRTEGNFLISLMATGVVAVLFHPLRERLQHGVNRLMYGERDEPAAVISRLGQRLEATLEPDSVLATVVETVAQALKLPYVAIALKDETGFVVAAAYGQGTGADESPAGMISDTDGRVVKMPLTYQSETVGQLIVAPRARNEKFSPADKNLLAMLSQQAGVAAHAIRLTDELRQLNLDLQRSREQLVTAREEERRRIRRDLHDGVGPILASLLQRLDAVRLLIPRDPGTAANMAENLKVQVKSTIADIRRLVYALRPPVLDELGLISAIREYTNEYQGTGRLQVTITAPESLPHLPAAVEVAAYRIILESFANVVHHAEATTCHITLKIEKQKSNSHFCVEIEDDGRGLSEEHHIGVGTISMRERTAELGGNLTIDSEVDKGTRVRACLPLSEA
jgi:signal transduction histidine kinase